MDVTESMWSYLSFSVYDLHPRDVWGVFAIVTLLYVGFLFLYFLRLALAMVPREAQAIVIAAAAFVGFILWSVISQDWFRALIVGNLAAVGACIGLALLLLPAYTLGQQFAEGGKRSLVAVVPYTLSLLYLFAHRSLIITLLYLGVLAYQLKQAVPDVLARLIDSGSSVGELRVVYPGIVVLTISGLLLTPTVITAYPALEILAFVATFVVGIVQFDRSWGYSPSGSYRSARIAGYVLLGVLALVAVVAYAEDFLMLPSQLYLVISGQLG